MAFFPSHRGLRPRLLATKLNLEALEVRTLLTGNSALTSDLPGGLTVDVNSYEPGSILVKYKHEANCARTACLDAPRLTQSLGGQWQRGFAAVRGLHKVALPQGLSVDDALNRYRSDPNVLYAEPDYRVHATAIPNDEFYDDLWGLNNVGQTGGTVDADADVEEAWDVTTGGGVVVAVIDTGVDYNHPDLNDNIWVNTGEIPSNGIDDDNNGFIDDIHGYDFFNNDGDPMDDHNHGTHVAGTIGAEGNNFTGIVGVNWDVEIMAIKFLDASGNGSTSDAIDAIGYAVANGATISNASWGGNEPFSQPLYDAIANARDAGHILVAGAGNGDVFGNGQNNDTNAFYPASYDLDNIISVAATDHNDNRAGFSNYGATTVDLAGPGVNILSTTPGNTYQSFSGTSMATPHVAGVASLVWQQNPTWTYDQVIDQILNTVDPVPSMQGITTTGGRLNAASALDNPVPPPPPPPPAPIPYIEDFQDNQAQNFQVRSGTWSVSAARYNVTPTVDDPAVSGVSTISMVTPLPSDFEVHAIANAAPEPFFFFNYSSNAYIVFDYQGVTDFKFAGVDVSGGQWVIGERTAGGWQQIASLADGSIAASTNYALRLVIQNDTDVSLYALGAPILTHSFVEVVNDGELGVGVRNSVSTFDDVQVVNYVPPPPPGNLPINEDFSDGVADHFEPRTAGWAVENGAYHATPLVGADAISTIRLNGPLPADLDLRATLHVESSNQYSNALLIFDYQNNLNFKFAGAYEGTDKWVIGHRAGNGWITDASFTQAINKNIDYAVQVVIEADNTVTLHANGSPKVTHTFADTLTDGEVGHGTYNALAHFDDIIVQQYIEPPPPPVGTLPISEDFSDGMADFFVPQVGNWNVSAGRYHDTPDGDAVSTLNIAGPLPNDLEIEATLNTDAGAGGFYSNGVLIFDYQGPTDFKFAGAYTGSNKWVIGHRTGSWSTDASFVEAINAGTDYSLRLVLESDNKVTLSVNDVPKVTYTFGDVVTDGAVGLGTFNALAHFDDVSVQEYLPPPPPPAGTLPLSEDFSDGVANFFQPQVGNWNVSDERYHDIPAGDAVSTLNIDGALPTDLELQARVNMESASGFYKNGFIIFDYQSPTDFKFAGAYVGTNNWVIGHRTTGWTTEASSTGAVNANSDYVFQLVIENDDTATLNVNGATKVSYTYAESLTDGKLGLGTYNALAHFDDVLVQEYFPPPPPPTGTLPLVEDFSDGVADFFQPRVGAWNVAVGRYHDAPAGDAISTLNIGGALPTDLEMQATVNTDPASGGLYSNGVLVFDYQSSTDFKFAGAYTGSNKWVIGQRTGSWTTLATFTETINANTDYDFQLVIENDNTVTLNVNGVTKVSHTFGESLTDGELGLGTSNAVAHFDDVIVQDYVAPPPPPSGTLPLSEDFSDGVADFFQPQAGSWEVSDGRYHDTPTGDAVSTLNVAGPLPTDLELQATVNMNAGGGGFYSNGVLIFDYQSSTNFKFAGAYTGSNKWVIGHRTSSWKTVATVSETVNAGTDYVFNLVIEGGSNVTLSVNGVPKISHTFGESLTDGSVGLGTYWALAHFDDVSLQAYSSGMAAAGFGATMDSNPVSQVYPFAAPNQEEMGGQVPDAKRNPKAEAVQIQRETGRTMREIDLPFSSPVTAAVDLAFANLGSETADGYTQGFEGGLEFTL